MGCLIGSITDNQPDGHKVDEPVAGRTLVKRIEEILQGQTLTISEADRLIDAICACISFDRAVSVCNTAESLESRREAKSIESRLSKLEREVANLQSLQLRRRYDRY